jgi:hypothetical protein
MRSQYKLLAEKYQLLFENDRDDIMAGLEYLSVDPDELITTDSLDKIGFFVKDLGNSKYVVYGTKDSDDVFLWKAPADYGSGTSQWYLLYIASEQSRQLQSAANIQTIGQLTRAYDKIINMLHKHKRDDSRAWRKHMKGITWDRDVYGSQKIISHWRDIEQ